MTFPLLRNRPSGDDHIRILSPEDIRFLRLPWDGRFAPGELERIARVQPVLSVWSERTGEYLIGGQWRHRPEIGTILELSASASAIELIDAFSNVCRDAGLEMIVVSEQAERRRRQFYESAHLDPIEEIVVYEIARVRPQTPATGPLRFERLNMDDDVAFNEILELDHAAFPWMWWNSREEFIEYSRTPGVAIDMGRDQQGRAIAYVGTTRYRSWGHLDRIAVAPSVQGTGIGKAALDYAVMSLAMAGARRVGLSTQAQNERSRRLYERYGFRRSPSHDYQLFGRTLKHDSDQIREG